MTLIICESLREIGDMACVTSVWSSRGQTLKFNFIGFESCQNSERMSDFLMNNQHVQETKKKRRNQSRRYQKALYFVDNLCENVLRAH